MLSFSPISTVEFQSGDRLRTSIKILILDCAARIICGNHDFINVRGGDLVKEPRLQSIETRRNYFTAMLMFKIRNEIVPQRLLDIFVYTKDTHDIATRSSRYSTFQVPEPNYEFY